MMKENSNKMSSFLSLLSTLQNKIMKKDKICLKEIYQYSESHLKAKMSLSKITSKMDMKFFKRCLHTSVSVVNIVTMVQGLFILATVADDQFKEDQFLVHGWNCKGLFLSLWVMVIQYVYFGIYSAIDIIDVYSDKNRKKQNSLSKLQDYMNTIASYLLFTIVFPFSLMIAMLFWSVYLWDRNLIYPPVLDEIFPPFLNHVMHTFPAPLSVIYMMTSNKIEPSKISTLSGLVAFLSIYSYVFFSYYKTEGKFIYLALHAMTPAQLTWALGFAGLGPIFFLFVGYKLNATLEYVKKHSPLIALS